MINRRALRELVRELRVGKTSTRAQHETGFAGRFAAQTRVGQRGRAIPGNNDRVQISIATTAGGFALPVSKPAAARIQMVPPWKVSATGLLRSADRPTVGGGRPGGAKSGTTFWDKEEGGGVNKNTSALDSESMWTTPAPASPRTPQTY